jgi:hypothetical protein
LSKQQVSFDTGEARSITKTTGYAMKSSDFAIFADATGGPIHITLPEASNRGTMIFIQKVDDSNNPVYVESAEGERTNRIPLLKATTRCEGWILVADGLKIWNVLSRSASAHSETRRKTRAGWKGTSSCLDDRAAFRDSTMNGNGTHSIAYTQDGDHFGRPHSTSRSSELLE